jgi:V/A-type H+-transporting ATPase subunit D
MADKILMNKNSLANLKSNLKEYNTALPVFEMKEQQLKEVIQNLEDAINRLRTAILETNEETKKWVGVMAEDTIDVSNLVKVYKLKTAKREVAGVTIKSIADLIFEKTEVDYFATPLWLDTAFEVIKDQKTNLLTLKLEEENIERVLEELVEARRMKNALKEVFIPETKNNIRKIEIYLGDVERLAIGCAKLVKKKKQDKNALV